VEQHIMWLNLQEVTHIPQSELNEHYVMHTQVKVKCLCICRSR